MCIVEIDKYKSIKKDELTKNFKGKKRQNKDKNQSFKICRGKYLQFLTDPACHVFGRTFSPDSPPGLSVIIEVFVEFSDEEVSSGEKPELGVEVV